MVNPGVRVIAGPQEWVLGPVPVTLPAQAIILAVSGTHARTVLLDGRKTRLSSATGLVAVDLARSTGYHRLVVDGTVFWFGTDDAKLGLAGVEAMLAHLRTLGTGWTGQALFSDGTGIRDAHVLYGWLDQWADLALAAVDAVLTSPRSVAATTRALSRRGGPAVLLVPTLRLLRSAPQRYLSENRAAGQIPVGHTAYDPLRVVVRRRTTTLNTVANRRAVGILHRLATLSREVLDSQPDTAIRVRCRLWLNKAQTLQRRPLAQTLRVHAAVGSAPRQSEEATDAPYRMTYASAHDLRRSFGWSASMTPLPRFSYVDRADSIYQAFVASCLAHVLGLSQPGTVLRSGQPTPAFTGPRFDLYYDTTCPPTVLRSWRASSPRPDDSRPDLLLHERATGRVALLDAKYRVARDGRAASEDSRKDVTAYLGLYGLHAITIAYPGPDDAHSVVAGRGRTIVELPVTPPAAGLVAALPTILATLERPRF